MKRPRRTAQRWRLLFGLIVVCGIAVVTATVGRYAVPSGTDATPRLAPALGDLYAPLTVEVFSDFGCSYCRDFALHTIPDLAAQYADSGKVYIQWRHMPILGQTSRNAALAAECVHEQGGFWAYHDAIFNLSGALDTASIKEAAVGAVSDEQAFLTCFAQQTTAAIVESDIEAAQRYGLQGTPSFVINGQPYTGKQPLAWWQQKLDPLLASAAE